MSAAMLVLACAMVAGLLLLALCVVHKTIDCAGLTEWTSDDEHGPPRFDSTILLKEGSGAMTAGLPLVSHPSCGYIGTSQS